MSSSTTGAAMAPNQPPPAAAEGTSIRRVAVASSIGTTIEYYDFFIYGTAAALVFPTVFFPALGSTAGTVASFATFAVAFFHVLWARWSSVTSGTASDARTRWSPP